MKNRVTQNGVTCDGPIPVTRPGYLYPGGCDAVTEINVFDVVKAGDLFIVIDRRRGNVISAHASIGAALDAARDACIFAPHHRIAIFGETLAEVWP
jgi:hypothetical protein